MARDNDGIISIKYANSGDVGLGGLDLNELWPISYSTPGGDFPQRIQFNQLFRYLSAFAKELNQGGPILEYSALIDYIPGAIVYGSDGLPYSCIVANGPASSVVNPVGDVSGTWLPTGIPRVQIYTIGATWTKPAGLKFALAMAWGAGGGGGGVDGQGSNTQAAGGGGASGAFSLKFLLASALGATEIVSVGAGGAGGSGNNNGSSGGNSSFGAHIQANGGGGGNGDVAAGTPSVRQGGNGGNASGGEINLKGFPGHKGTAASNASGRVVSGEGGGWGGGYGQQGNGDGIDGASPGAGGSGACVYDVATNYTGGDGGDGRVIVLEFF